MYYYFYSNIYDSLCDSKDLQLQLYEQIDTQNNKNHQNKTILLLHRCQLGNVRNLAGVKFCLCRKLIEV